MLANMNVVVHTQLEGYFLKVRAFANLHKAQLSEEHLGCRIGGPNLRHKPVNTLLQGNKCSQSCRTEQ